MWRTDDTKQKKSHPTTQMLSNKIVPFSHTPFYTHTITRRDSWVKSRWSCGNHLKGFSFILMRLFNGLLWAPGRDAGYINPASATQPTQCQSLSVFCCSSVKKEQHFVPFLFRRDLDISYPCLWLSIWHFAFLLAQHCLLTSSPWGFSPPPGHINIVIAF